MSGGRKHKHPEHVNHERWLVSYADFITLLFAFFVVLYSSSQVDSRKVGKLAAAIQVAFQQMGVFPASNSKVPLSNSEPMPFSDVQVIENVIRNEDMQRLVQPNTKDLSGSSLPGPLKSMQDELEKALAPEITRNVVTVTPRTEGLVITLRELGFFESGSATLRRTSMDSIDRLASVLANRSEMLRIEGHTDNVPIHNKMFNSNWELSTARATELIKVFIMDYHFDPTRMVAGGYAEFHPVDTNATPEGRSHNRRVDIVILAPPPGPQIYSNPDPPPGTPGQASEPVTVPIPTVVQPEPKTAKPTQPQGQAQNAPQPIAQGSDPQ